MILSNAPGMLPPPLHPRDHLGHCLNLLVLQAKCVNVNALSGKHPFVCVIRLENAKSTHHTTQ